MIAPGGRLDPLAAPVGHPVAGSRVAATHPLRPARRAPAHMRITYWSRKAMAIEVRIPTILRSYTGGQKSIEGTGSTLDELLADLNGRYDGLRERLVDESVHRWPVRARQRW
jgi:hypothetical protein